MWLRLIMCRQTVSINLGRLKALQYTLLYTTLLIPPPYLPLHSLHPFNRAIACSQIFSRCLVPPLLLLPCSIPSVFNSHRVDWNSEILPFLPLPPYMLYVLVSTTKHDPKRSSRSGLALSQSGKECHGKCISHIAWCASVLAFNQWACAMLFRFNYDDAIIVFSAEGWEDVSVLQLDSSSPLLFASILSSFSTSCDGNQLW